MRMKILWPWGRYSFANPLFLLSLLLFDLSVNPLHSSSLTCMAISLSENWTEWNHFYHFYFTRNWWVSPFLSLHNIYSRLQLSLLHLSILLSLNVFYEHFIDTFSLHSFFPSTPLYLRLLPPLLYSSCSSSSPLFSISAITSPISQALYNWYELRSLRAIGAWWYDIPRKARTWQLSSRWGPHK